MSRRVVSPEELTYYRAHFLEALHEDAVVCLVCGAIFKSLPQHVSKHGLTIVEYRARWGYNRTNPLTISDTSELRRRVAFAHKIWERRPPDLHVKGHEVLSKLRSTFPRLEGRLNQSAAAKARIATGWPSPALKVRDDLLRELGAGSLTPREIAARVGVSYKHLRYRLRSLGLLQPLKPPVSTAEVLALRHAGLWPSEIAARTGLTKGAVLARLRRSGVDFPIRTSPRPNARRRITDENLLSLASAGLQPAEIASQVGMSEDRAAWRLRRLRQHGLLPPKVPRIHSQHRRQPAVSAEELFYYRAHFREAIGEDGVVCLECGEIWRSMLAHVRKHGLSPTEYRAKWGYNRNNPVMLPALREIRRQVALAMNLPGLSPPKTIEKALEVRRGVPSPHRPENRLYQKEAGRARVASGWRQPKLRAKDDLLRELVREGLTPQDIAARTGLGYRQVRKRLRALGLGATLIRPFQLSQKDLEILALRQTGLWSSEIATRIGMTVHSVDKHLRRLRKHGVTVPPPNGPRPNPWRRVTNEQLLAFVRSGLRAREIAAKVGIAKKNVYWRLQRLRERGLLPPRAAGTKKRKRVMTTQRAGSRG